MDKIKKTKQKIIKKVLKHLSGAKNQVILSIFKGQLSSLPNLRQNSDFSLLNYGRYELKDSKIRVEVTKSAANIDH